MPETNPDSFPEILLAGSSFLKGLAIRYPDCLTEPPEKILDSLFSMLNSDAGHTASESDLKQILRIARNKAALTIALADLKGHWSLEQVTQSLTEIADTCLNTAINWLLLDAQRQGKLMGLSKDNPAKGSGYVVLAMGKHGAHELNFSSDVDLIVLYDPEIASLAENTEPSTLFVRITKRLVNLMQDMTRDGYAYRVDLRLRPDPRATQVALSFDAAMNYYESMGQNWERAAMIKARPTAGDMELGQRFIKEIQPFIWRKYLDFAAIAEVHSLKRQIHAVKGHGEIAVLGHNLKLGRGGIREIEFFVQTQQLIAGGRNPDLRGIATVDMLNRLVTAEWISATAASDLTDAYRFLRQIEHRIQMVADQQTHQLPDNQERFDDLAIFSGFANSEAFASKLRATFELVQKYYDDLFEDDNADTKQSLNFAGDANDEETLAALQEMGFSQPEMISATIKGWYAGRYRAMRTETARERLTELLPALMTALGRSGDPDGAFAAFDRFVSGLPTGIQLFSLLRANPHFVDLIANILGAAPRLAQEMSRRPKMLDAVLEPTFFSQLPDRAEIQETVAAAVPQTLDFDQVLDQCRIVGREQMFRIGVRTLTDTMSAADAGQAYSHLAECLVARLLQAVQADLEIRHGVVEGGKVCVVAMGKLGGKEMTAASDLDLIVIYDHREDAIASSGPKQISSNQYFSRMTQRLITAISAPTPEGVLYEVDMRLRPSGNKGPIATRISSFIDYQNNSAWTWEKMALTRARVVAGDLAFKTQVDTAISNCLCTRRDAQEVVKDAIAMRKTMLSNKKPNSPWDLKPVSGGMVDLEFIIQVLQIIHAAENPDVLSPNILAAISNLSANKVLDQQTANQLENTCKLYQHLTQILKLGISGKFHPEKSPPGLTKLINAATASPDLATSEALLEEAQHTIKEIFDRVMKEAG